MNSPPPLCPPKDHTLVSKAYTLRPAPMKKGHKRCPKNLDQAQCPVRVKCVMLTARLLLPSYPISGHPQVIGLSHKVPEGNSAGVPNRNLGHGERGGAPMLLHKAAKQRRSREKLATQRCCIASIPACVLVDTPMSTHPERLAAVVTLGRR